MFCTRVFKNFQSKITLCRRQKVFWTKYGLSVPFWASDRNKFKREFERLQFGIKCLLNTKGGMQNVRRFDSKCTGKQ